MRGWSRQSARAWEAVAVLPAPAGDGPAAISRVFTGDSETPGTAGASGAWFRAVRARADGQDPDAAYGAG
ncbi:hypothetical protein ACFWSJ_36975, partial [Streptomyces niveus]|uniref:hypothetical protein n=1 Tax=Streptomyces niveus TaxID=193462 RepID=UPI003668C800